MTVVTATDRQLDVIRKKLATSSCGIVDVRQDIPYTEANALILKLVQEEKDAALQNSVPKELNRNEMPEPPQMRFLYALMADKVGALTVVKEMREDYSIPENQMFTKAQVDKLLYRLRKLPTNPDRTAHFEEAFQSWTLRI